MWQQVGKAKANALCLCLCVRAGFVWQSSIGHTCRDVYAHTFIYTYIHTCLKKMCKLSWAKTMKNPPKNKNNKNAQHQQRRWAQVRDREERESRRLAESGINRWIHQYQCSDTYTRTHIVYLSLYSATKTKHCKRMQNKFAFAFFFLLLFSLLFRVLSGGESSSKSRRYRHAKCPPTCRTMCLIYAGLPL